MAILCVGAGHLYTVVGELASFDGNSDSVVSCEEPQLCTSFRLVLCNEGCDVEGAVCALRNDAVLRHNAGDQLRGSDVERWVPGADTRRRQPCTRGEAMGQLSLRPLLHVNLPAALHAGVQRGEGRGDVERHAVVLARPPRSVGAVS